MMMMVDGSFTVFLCYWGLFILFLCSNLRERSLVTLGWLLALK